MPPSAAPTPELLARLGGLRLQAEALLAGTLAGMHGSPFQGFSAEFDQYRGYAPGDDPGFFDWRIFARTGQAMVKRFRDENNTSLYLVVDSSASMGYGQEESLSKLHVASLMAAALATLAFRQRDAVGLFGGGSQLAIELPPRTGAAHYQEALQRLESLQARGLTDLGHLLSMVSQRLKSGSMVFVFTDLWQETENLLSGLRQLRSRCQALALVQVMSAGERDLRDKGDMIYRDMESGESLRLSPEAFRESYAAAFKAHQEHIRGACRDLGVRFHPVDMALPLDLSLRALFTRFLRQAGKINLEFLHPWALLLMTSLAIPVWLHLRQRSQPRQAGFPSLLLLRRGFPKAMQKQKLRDLLQLILRLLLLLCLVLALAQPNGKQDLALPKRGVFLIDNGLWGQIRQPGGASLLNLQLQQSQALEKTWPEGLTRIPLLHQAGLSASEDRYGDMKDAVNRALAAARKAVLAKAWLYRFFSWTGLQGMQSIFLDWLKESPRNRLMLWDFLSTKDALPRFESANIKKDSSGGWHLQLRQSEERAGSKSDLKAKPGTLRLSAGVEKRLQPQGLTLQTRLPSGEWQGQIALDVPEQDLGPWNTWHFATGKIGSRRLIHYGSTWASLPSLKQGLNLSAIVDLSDGQPWPTLTSKGKNAFAGVFLAGQMPPSDRLEKIAGYVLEGGALIISAGSGTDLVSLNSRVLGPLGLGRLTTWTRHASSLRILAKTQNFSAIGANIETWGKPGEVREQFASSLMPETQVLLQAGDMPLLLFKRAGRGALLVWTTEIDSLAWTDIGLTPFLPLVHQAFLKTLEFGDDTLHAASDSVVNVAVLESDIQVRDPQGKAFTRVQKTLGGWRLGPFPKAGLYRITSEADTQALVVNLRQPWLFQALENDTAVKERLMNALASVQNQVSIESSPPETVFTASERMAWLPWLAAAVMLLLLDGLVALVLNPKSQTPSAPWVSKAPHV